MSRLRPALPHPGARCEHPAGHEGPHRNGLLIWHDPPMLFVDGKPYEPDPDA